MSSLFRTFDAAGSAPGQLDAEDDDPDQQADQQEHQQADAQDVRLRGDVDADDLVLGLDLPVVGAALGLDLRLIIADGDVGRRQELDRDDLLLVLVERGDQVGLDLGPPVERQVGEDAGYC